MTDIGQPEWAELFAASNTRALARVHKAEPGEVVSFDRATATCVVQIMVADSPDPLPPLQDVPVVYPGGAGFVMTFPLAPGDRVLVVYVDIDPSAYQNNGKLARPNILRRHGRYPYAFPLGKGAASEIDSPAAPNALIISKGATRLVVDPDFVHVGGSSTSVPLALAPQVEARLTAIENWLNGHTHPVAGPTAGVSLPPLVPGAGVDASKARGV